MAGGDGIRIQQGQSHQMGIGRAQDDAMVGYVFQRPAEQDYNAQANSFQTKQVPRAWALADDAIIDNVSMAGASGGSGGDATNGYLTPALQNHEKWKYPMNKIGVPQQSQPQQIGIQAMNNVHLPYEIHPMQLKVIISSSCLKFFHSLSVYLTRYNIM